MTQQVHGEPAEAHELACALWTSPDPLDACDCGAETEDTDRGPALALPGTPRPADHPYTHAVALACDADQEAVS